MGDGLFKVVTFVVSLALLILLMSLFGWIGPIEFMLAAVVAFAVALLAAKGRQAPGRLR